MLSIKHRALDKRVIKTQNPMTRSTSNDYCYYGAQVLWYLNGAQLKLAYNTACEQPHWLTQWTSDLEVGGSNLRDMEILINRCMSMMSDDCMCIWIVEACITITTDLMYTYSNRLVNSVKKYLYTFLLTLSVHGIK